MTKEEKGLIIEELAEKFRNTPYFYVTDSSGLTVEKINNFRRLCFQKGVEFRVVKNTLIAKALEKNEINTSSIKENVLKGFSGIIFSPESGQLPVKLLQEFRRKEDKPVLKGAFIDSELYIGDDQIEALTKLKSKNELIGELIALLQSPAKNVVSGLQSGKHKLAGIVKTLQERQN